MNILYEDKNLLVVYKEGNLPVQSKSFSQMDLETLIANYERQKGEKVFVGLINRLDQPVEGIVLIAKNKDIASKISKNMEKTIQKKYLAVVWGKVDNPKGKIVDYLIKNKNISEISTINKGKRSELNYRVIKENGDYSLLEIELITGRFHQIRCQLSNFGHPIVGDRKYGSDNFSGKIGLCAYSLSFINPVNNKKMEFKVEPQNEAFRLI